MASATAKSRAARACSRRSRRRVEDGTEGRRVGEVVEGGEAEAGGQGEEGGEPVPEVAGHGGVAVLQLGDQGVGLGDQVEQHGQGGGDVQVVVEGGLEPVPPAGRAPRDPPAVPGPPDPPWSPRARAVLVAKVARRS